MREMDFIKFGLTGGLNDQQLRMIHEAVLKIMDEIGMECAHAKTVEAVTAVAGVRYENGRLKFSPDLVNATITQAREIGKKERPKLDKLRITAPWNCFNVVDMDTGEVRATTAADCVEMVKLVASYNEYGPPPVYPCDLDQRIQVLWIEKLGHELAPGFCGALVTHDAETLRWIGELYAVMGQPYSPWYQFVISPLRFDYVALDVFWLFKDDPHTQVRLSLCPIPVAGLTAPLSTTGALSQSIAESLGGLIVGQALGATSPDQLPEWRTDYGDMRDLTVGYSLPENVMVQVLLQQLSEYFCCIKRDCIYLNTNAKLADGFAAVDRMGYLLMLGLAGYRDFIMGAGQMSMDEIFSPAQFIIDMEIGRYVQKLLDGITWSGDPNSIVAAVAEGVAEGNFLANPATLETLPYLFDSLLFRRSNVGQWRAAGSPTLEQLAIAKAKEAIASYRYTPNLAKQRELDQVFAKACQALGVDPKTQPIPERLF